jgi:transposase
VGGARLAGHQKKVTRRGATLVFEDETGFLLLPLVRRTLAPRGRTPVLRHRARQRDKVSVAAALTLSPSQGHVNLYYRTYPNAYVNNVAYAQFLRGLLRRVPGPLVLVHDQGNMHKGEPIRALCRDVPRLDLNMFPAYAPELNPPEHLWNFEKHKELANFVPHDVRELDDALCDRLQRVRHDQQRLRTFFSASHLPWDGLTVFF